MIGHGQLVGRFGRKSGRSRRPITGPQLEGPLGHVLGLGKRIPISSGGLDQQQVSHLLEQLLHPLIVSLQIRLDPLLALTSRHRLLAFLTFLFEMLLGDLDEPLEVRETSNQFGADGRVNVGRSANSAQASLDLGQCGLRFGCCTRPRFLEQAFNLQLKLLCPDQNRFLSLLNGI